MEDFKIRFGKYKGKTLKELPDDYLLYMVNNTTMFKGKVLAYIKEKLKLPKDKFEIEVKDSVNHKDGTYIVEAYNSDLAIKRCIKKNNIQISQSFDGTCFSYKKTTN